MPTVFAHALVPLAIAAATGRGIISPKLALAGAAFAVLPDLDVVSFRLGIDYADAWGHRGATHSLFFAAMCAGIIALLWHQARNRAAWLFLTLSMASHGMLDTLTDGGLGAALLWPFSEARFFAPVTPVRVSPIGTDFFSVRGLDTVVSELKWIVLPCLGLAFAGWALRHATPSRT